MKFTADQLFDWREEKRGVEDGVYDVTGIDSLKVEDDLFRRPYIEEGEDEKKVREFVKKYPDFAIANAYETGIIFFLSKHPSRLKFENWDGSGFNYGSTNILKDCPKDILILAEND